MAVLYQDPCYNEVCCKGTAFYNEYSQLQNFCLFYSGQFKMASKYLQESLEIVKVIYGSESIEVANELRKLSEVLISAHKWKHALEVTKEAIKLFTMHYGKSHDSVTELCAAESELKDLTEHCVSNYSKINT